MYDTPIIINATRRPIRRTDFSVDVDRNADIALAQQAIVEAVKTDKRVIGEPPPRVLVDALSGAAGVADRPGLDFQHYLYGNTVRAARACPPGAQPKGNCTTNSPAGAVRRALDAAGAGQGLKLRNRLRPAPCSCG